MTRKWRLGVTVGLFAVTSVALLRGLPAPPAQPTQPAQAAQPALPAPKSQERPRLFPPQDLGLLEAPDRDEWQKPDLIMDTFGSPTAPSSASSALAADGSRFGWRAASDRTESSTPKTFSRR